MEIETWQKLIRVLTHEIMNSVFPISSLSTTLLDSFNEHNYPESLKGEVREVMETTFKGIKVIEKRSSVLNSFVQSYNDLSNIPMPVFESFEIIALFQHQETLVKKQSELD